MKTQVEDPKFGRIIGIPVDIFIASNPSLQEKHPEVPEKLLFSLGINVKSKNTRITWHNFLRFNSLIKYFTAPQKEFVRFWMLVGSNHSLALVSEPRWTPHGHEVSIHLDA